uniref:TonB-dependent receptor domain-containing protein n=1 Tax=uncultured Sphingomonas sp. TaxID=158754 RepID=UPI0025CFD1DF|nr:TonB-dependent receptor [uncultured Sphingomonas sp.]
MTSRSSTKARAWLGGSSIAAMLAISCPGAAFAQTAAAPQPDETPAEQAGEGESGTEGEIVVTGSRIARAGFDQPTPTTVLGEVELRQGARPNIQQILNDQPQFRPTVTPQVSVGNTSTGTAPVDLRGLGIQRTLTLIDGRRFVGRNNLNFVPTNLIERVEVVTGGASAAWGSDAVAGVVNILLKDELDGVSLGGFSGVSSRGDGRRYGLDGSFGLPFADGAGQFLIGAEYIDDKGILDRNSRRNLGSAGVVRVNPFSTTDLSTRLVRDVNFGNTAPGGLITTGVLAGQVFNSDGTLRGFRTGTPLGPGAFPGQVLGGEDAIGLYDFVSASTPFDRLSTYARLSYDLGPATVYVDGSYGRTTSDSRFVPDFLVPPLTIQATNPFLRPELRNQLTAAGQTSFTLGRFFEDILTLNLNSKRENYEGAIGVEADLGGGFSVSGYYSHGEIDSDQRLENARLAANFSRAINAVQLGSGQIVCAVNADADPANDDPACVPLNPFGRGNASAAAVDYVTGTQRSLSTEKLDAAAVEVEGDLLQLPAGPLTIAFGAEARREKIESSRDEATRAGGFGIPIFTSDLNGGFNVREGFVEAAVPLVDADGLFDLDVNGAARYSDYSRSGDVWAWKLGATARLFDSVLLRGTRSRDVRAPTTGELFAAQAITVGPLVDQDRAGRNAPGYNPTPATVTTFTGGNPNLDLELADTLTVGASFSPSFLPRLNLSADFYDIEIKGAIIALNGSTLTLACAQGTQAACDAITRDATGTVTQVQATQQNLATFQTRGVDIEASYLLRMDQFGGSLPGTVRFRGLATYVDRLIFDTGITRVDTAGEVGDSVQRGTPKWRATLGATYQDAVLGLDLRVRYIDGGSFNSALTTLVNNRISSRTYVDLGAQFKVQDRFTLFGNVNNLFDRDPPLSTVGNPNYDIVGTYFTVGARVNF